jgi:hypothetical protein
MTPVSDSQKPAVSRWTNFKRLFRKISIIAALVILLILGLFLYWKYFYTYSDGYRAGLLQKFSRKGTLFKTYEGEIILSSIKGNSNVAIASEKFLFSVTSDSLAASMDTLQGQNVIVHYRQKNAPLFWRGDSPYIVDGVKPR